MISGARLSNLAHTHSLHSFSTFSQLDMAITRSVSKGKARAVSPQVSGSIRAATGRAAAARLSIERAALGRALNAATSSEDDGRLFQDVTNSQSALTPLVNGAREDGTLRYMRNFIGGASVLCFRSVC